MIKHTTATLHGKTFKRAFTLPEVIVVVLIVGIVATFVSQMIGSGTQNVAKSVWYSDRLRESQDFFKRIGDDLRMAANETHVNYGQVLNEISRTPKFVLYLKPDSSATFINPFESAIDGSSNSNTARSFNVLNGAGAANRKIMSFQINKTDVVGGNIATNQTGYLLKVDLYLDDPKRNGKPDPKIIYEKKIVSGSQAEAEEDGHILGKKVIMSEVEYIFMHHKVQRSQMDNSVSHSMFYIFIHVKDHQNELSQSQKDFNQSIKVPIEIRDMTSL
ncbi:MAG TPA: prepilin-type N-terminal cleavage/methylation domain-containing protein [Candidatus Wallbacteria bacterium]|nr:prepilin-type N-terminal cleavage/methylation domain-containing protein [Candidatus Wallbacteria bacterium]